MNIPEFDLTSSLITLLVSPLILAMLKILLNTLKEWGAFALEGVLYWASRFIRHRIAASLTMRRYCRLQLSGQSRNLFIPSSSGTVVNIDNVYIPLSLGTSREGSASQYNESTVLHSGNRLLIIGDPGSGKSSLVKRLFRDACKDGIEDAGSSRLPVLVELRKITPPDGLAREDSGQWLYDQIRMRVASCDAYKMADCFDIYVGTSGLLVLLDGLDEISSNSYPILEDAIIGLDSVLARSSELNLIAVTTRTQFYQQVREAYRDSYQSVVHVRPFGPNDIYDFLTRWEFQGVREGEISRIYKDLTDRPTLRKMCENPLVLSMYVAEDQSGQRMASPESRTEFYLRLADELIINRRLRQRRDIPAPGKLRDQREKILGLIAYNHILDHRQSMNCLLWEDALRATQQVVGCDKVQAASIFRDLSRETGLVTEDRIGESFRFLHLTFCEFFAAFEAVRNRENGFDELVRSYASPSRSGEHMQSRLLEAIPFAVGLLPSYSKQSGMARVVGVGSSRLIAQCFLESKAYDQPDWVRFVEMQKATFLSTPEDAWDDQWLADLHLFSVVLRDANTHSKYAEGRIADVDIEALFQELLSKQQGSLSKILSTYAAQDAAAAFRLAEVIELDIASELPAIIIANLAQPPLLGLVLDHAESQPQRIGLWSALLAEAGLESNVVARLLSRRDTPAMLEAALEKVPIGNRWTLNHGKRLSVAKCVTVALHQRESHQADQFRILHLLGKLEAPRNFSWGREMNISILFLLSAVFFLVAGMLVDHAFRGDLLVQIRVLLGPLYTAITAAACFVLSLVFILLSFTLLFCRVLVAYVLQQTKLRGLSAANIRIVRAFFGRGYSDVVKAVAATRNDQIPDKGSWVRAFIEVLGSRYRFMRERVRGSA